VTESRAVENVLTATGNIGPGSKKTLTINPVLRLLMWYW